MMGVSDCVILLVPELDILRSVGSLEPIDSNRGRAHLLPQIQDHVTPSKVAPQRNFSFDWTKQKPFLCVGVVQMFARNTASRYIPGKKKTLLRVLSMQLRVSACLEKYLTYNLALGAPGCPSCQPQKTLPSPCTWRNKRWVYFYVAVQIFISGGVQSAGGLNRRQRAEM